MTGIIGFDNDNVLTEYYSLNLEKLINTNFYGTLHVKFVPSYRGRGISNEMKKFAINFYKNEYDGFGVYRDKPEARAYNWYYKNNHVPICK